MQSNQKIKGYRVGGKNSFSKPFLNWIIQLKMKYFSHEKYFFLNFWLVWNISELLRKKKHKLNALWLQKICLMSNIWPRWSYPTFSIILKVVTFWGTTIFIQSYGKNKSLLCYDMKVFNVQKWDTQNLTKQNPCL